MANAHRSTPATCAYCNASIESEHGYRRHLNRQHDPSELGPIDRRRYERYEPTPNAVSQVGGQVTDGLTELTYPVDRATMGRYATYGFLTSAFVAALLAVGL